MSGMSVNLHRRQRLNSTICTCLCAITVLNSGANASEAANLQNFKARLFSKASLSLVSTAKLSAVLNLEQCLHVCRWSPSLLDCLGLNAGV